MLRELLNKLSGTHLTILALGAMFVPGALYAIPSFSNVAIEDPNTGTLALVNNSRALQTFDYLASYANSPANIVRINGECLDGSSNITYTPSTGKALIVKSVYINFFGGVTSSDNYVYLITNSARKYIVGIDNSDVSGTQSIDLGNGYYTYNSEGLTLECSTTGEFFVTITGYLVPASIAPQTDPGQSVPAPMIMKGGKRI